MAVPRRVALLNDFEAVGYGIPALDSSDIVVLNAGQAKDKVPAPRARALP